MAFFAVISAVLWLVWPFIGQDFAINKNAGTEQAPYTIGQALKEKINWLLPFTYSGLLTFYLVMLNIFPISGTTAISSKALSTLVAIGGILGSLMAIALAKVYGKRLPIIRICGVGMTGFGILMFNTSNGVLASVSALLIGVFMFLPVSSTSILRKVLDRIAAENRRPVVLATVSPMDDHGYMSLSVSAIYERDLINRGALTIVEVNPNFPRTFGDTQVHVSEVAALVESDRPIPVSNLAPYTEVDATIGKYIASLVEDGSTIQLGIGNIPNAVAAELKTKKHLGIHTEMFTETMVDLIECGAVDNSCKGLYDGYSVCSFTMGSQRLYDYIDNNPSVLFKSCTFTNDPYTIGKNNKFVSVNASLEIDLTGQCASETVGYHQWSGTGGQSETVQGSQMSKGGKSIIAMHSTYTTKDENGKEVLHSKIVPFLHEGAAVTTSRNDTDYVVTEYGIAWLRGKNVAERAEALITIAHPDFRDALRAKAEEYEIW